MITLYQYQQEDVEKAVQQIGVLNASDMGTGKTHSGIEIANKWRRQVFEETGLLLPILVVCPMGVFESWKAKYAEQCPNLRVTVDDKKASSRELLLYRMETLQSDVYITNWESIRLFKDEILERGIIFSVIIGDEIHRIANPDSKVSQSLKHLPSHRRLAMSGTPSGSVPWNIWSILNWVRRDLFPSYWNFVDRFVDFEVTASGGYGEFKDFKNLDEFHELISPFYIRHNKNSYCCPTHPNGVTEFLPDKVYESMYVDMTYTQKKIYDAMSNNMVAWLGENEDTPFVARIAMTKIMRLIQTSIATPHINEFDEIELRMPSPKISMAEQFIKENPDEQVIVYTSFKKAAVLAYEHFQKQGIKVGLITGDVKLVDRESIQQQFADRKIQVIVAVIRATAEGVDGLQQSCSTVIFLNRDSVMRNKQAEDRIHRDGQTKTVVVIDIISRDTIDEDRIETLNLTWNTIKSLLNKHKE